MSFDFEDYVLDIAEDVSKSMGDTLDVSTTRWINRPVGNERVKDATLAFYVDGKKRHDDLVLLISNPGFPGEVQADVLQARRMAARVEQEVGQNIVAPVSEGTLGTQTYAAFSRLSPLSEFRLVRAMQKRRAASSILPWLVEFAKQTKQHRNTPDEFERYFIQPLVALCDDRDLSKNVRKRADEYLEFLRDGRADLFTVVQHGDFWIGNVFFQRRLFPNINPTLGAFSVIDWKGARPDGYPCIDWMRLCASLFKIGSRKNSEFTLAYSNALGISTYDFQVYCFVAMGRLGSELDHFPKGNFVALCDQVLEFADSHAIPSKG